MLIFKQKSNVKNNSDISIISSANIPSGCPLITGAYNILAVYIALVSARSLYAEYSKKHRKKSVPLETFPVIWDRLLSEIEPFVSQISDDI